ncbi:glycosyl transferase [Neptunomonas phycophila]|uniref:glycosyl transferase n=1 Tax=Neptunomonas phycophila TaxID=1572645 RepID=UPI0026E2597B|nr:glycosyl transferase [Neptunomonas phycophila]MDO6466540.1 glycosyl transferase [Neptunomonas phycophila]
MSDYKQTGSITTLHRLPGYELEKIEKELRRYSKRNPMTLLLPSLYSELEGPALENIIEELKKADYINQIVIGLDQADEEQFEKAKKFFDRLPQKKMILWNDGPRLRAIADSLEKAGLGPSEPGKGRNVWYCIGYILAANNSKAVALHDCDILTYSRDIPARLFYPIVSPALDYEFCKGYYTRVNSEGRLSGRVTRLFVQPLITSLKKLLGNTDYLEFLDAFRYPLSGEFSLSTDLLSAIRIPSDWGLEIGILSEAYRNMTPRRVCQVDIADNYDHKHQDMGTSDHDGGLSRMTYEIAKAVFRKLGTEGTTMDSSFFRALKAVYLREALDMLEKYDADAHINGLSIDINSETSTIEFFSGSILDAGEKYLHNPMEIPFIPNWNRVFSAFPDLPEQLLEAVEIDNA